MTGLTPGSTPAPPARPGRTALPSVSVAGSSRVKSANDTSVLANDTCRVWSSVAKIALSQATCLKPGPINVRACSRIFNHHSSLRMHL